MLQHVTRLRRYSDDHLSAGLNGIVRVNFLAVHGHGHLAASAVNAKKYSGILARDFAAAS